MPNSITLFHTLNSIKILSNQQNIIKPLQNHNKTTHFQNQPNKSQNPKKYFITKHYFFHKLRVSTARSERISAAQKPGSPQ